MPSHDQFTKLLILQRHSHILYNGIGETLNAIHLEHIEDLITTSFLLAFRCFVAEEDYLATLCQTCIVPRHSDLFLRKLL